MQPDQLEEPDQVGTGLAQPDRASGPPGGQLQAGHLIDQAEVRSPGVQERPAGELLVAPQQDHLGSGTSSLHEM
ncbi:MAG TPA: hypothetical protein VHF27_03155 [Acidimicrobiales bacterium]|nr:hypothetical protein [Acidimicrobiales bacterium]